jgi:hypothetical protein
MNARQHWLGVLSQDPVDMGVAGACTQLNPGSAGPWRACACAHGAVLAKGWHRRRNGTTRTLAPRPAIAL